MRGPERERGAALLTVLLLVAVMAVIAAVMLERLGLAAKLAGNGQAMSQARLYATSAESIAAGRIKAMIEASPGRTVDGKGLLGRDFTLPLARGVVTVRVDDGGNCFNLNSLVEGQEGSFAARPQGIAQFRSLMISLQVDPASAARIADGTADWIDSDDRPGPAGTEDVTYDALPVPYRTAGRLIGDVSEIRAVRGMTAEVYARLRPWLCALPEARLSPFNINTLRPDQARLLTAALPSLTLERARALLVGRPAAGWGDAAAFGGGGQLATQSRWFLAAIRVRVDSVELEERALIDAGVTPARIAFRSWGGAETR